MIKRKKELEFLLGGNRIKKHFLKTIGVLKSLNFTTQSKLYPLVLPEKLLLNIFK